MSKEEAIQIINEIRCSNSFTMGLNIDQYISDFIARYEKMTGIVIPNNVIDVAIVLKSLQKQCTFKNVSI